MKFKILKVAFGNKDEAFIEDRFTDGVNVIYSNDNNRGKTLVIQGLMYSMGYESIFPSTFSYKDKYFYSEVEIDNQKYSFLRKSNNVSIRGEDFFQIFNSIGEMKYFISKNIFNIPKIIKDGRETLVDLTVLYELFFIGQDQRKPSSLISTNYYKKADFKNMIYQLYGFDDNNRDLEDIDSLKKKLNLLKDDLKRVKKRISIYNESKSVSKITSRMYDSEQVNKKSKAIAEINSEISKIQRSRQSEINRKNKLENLIKELNSLNREITAGNVKCADCNGQNIVFVNDTMTFDVSNVVVRNKILNSIKENIELKESIIGDLTSQINFQQSRLLEELKDTPPDFRDIVVYQQEILASETADVESFRLQGEISLLNTRLYNANSLNTASIDSKRELDQKITNSMNKFYKNVDPNGILVFEDIFTTKSSTFSGSEEQEFYFCKLLSLNEVINHNFPIIVDSFRDGELSSEKEDKMLEVYCSLGKQVILTSTVKQEEYRENKYHTASRINDIDYSGHEDCKVLNSTEATKFLDILSEFEGIIV
ncbi:MULTISPECIES: hypothetical protein [Vibrio]|uniref:hypothetical protein n=1 Tax=Vibrio TaxID=662 RepID=UPI0001B956B0|nr:MULTISPECIES: hypothetical protein [Vibrio]EEX31056.1 hypothetical cytosolic protein [Vibrio coralliilyticus ATCC BAA-450]MDE3896257.1 hypothetical protein [Vibrio sp. CC007]